MGIGFHGPKTTLVQALTGIWAARHSEEKRRGVTIKLGYADAVVLRCPSCPPPGNYFTLAMAGGWKCPKCGGEAEFVRKISFVDSPGHERLMATMISGASLMDGCIFVIAANEPCPQPQTREHFAALEIVGVKNIVIVQNKVELVSREKAMENFRQIKKFISGTFAEDAPIIPVSAVLGVNLDVLLYFMEKHIPDPVRDPSKPLRMYIARSFDVNKPGTKPKDLVGGVIGGTIIQGKVRVGDEIEIRPGVAGKGGFEPIYADVVSLQAGDVWLEEALPGGLIGIGTKLDPSLTKADGLIGNVVGAPGTLPPVRDDLCIELHLMERVVGSEELAKVENVHVNESLMLNVGSAVTVGTISSVRGDEVEIKLRRPVCAEDGQRVAVSRIVSGRWRLIGWGLIR
ncbi:MAG: translation initiation factor IF-2 subunit gamma [Candidatus Jordarchaeales archaeon]